MNMLAASMLALWLTTALGFGDSLSCAVEGYVDANPGDIPVFTRVDSCTDINQRIEDNALILWSPHRWAVIVLPGSGTHIPFSYRWGAPHAYLDEQPLPVSWGRLAVG